MRSVASPQWTRSGRSLGCSRRWRSGRVSSAGSEKPLESGEHHIVTEVVQLAHVLQPTEALSCWASAAGLLEVSLSLSNSKGRRALLLSFSNW